MKSNSRPNPLRSRAYSSMNHEEYSLLFPPQTPLLKFFYSLTYFYPMYKVKKIIIRPSQIPEEIPNELILPPGQKMEDLEAIEEEEE